jgi:hypothetical protein
VESISKKKLPTWSGKSRFEYSGSIKLGTDIFFGKAFCYHEFIGAEKYQMLLRYFKGKTVSLGTSRTGPPNGSVGIWLLLNVSRRALASYVGPILLHEGYAKRINGESKMIHFHKRRLTTG